MRPSSFCICGYRSAGPPLRVCCVMLLWCGGPFLPQTKKKRATKREGIWPVHNSVCTVSAQNKTTPAPGPVRWWALSKNRLALSFRFVFLYVGCFCQTFRGFWSCRLGENSRPPCFFFCRLTLSRQGGARTHTPGRLRFVRVSRARIYVRIGRAGPAWPRSHQSIHPILSRRPLEMMYGKWF